MFLFFAGSFCLPEKILLNIEFENGLGVSGDGLSLWNSNGEIETAWVDGYGDWASTEISREQKFQGKNSLKIQTTGRSSGTDDRGQVGQNNNPQYGILDNGVHVKMVWWVFFDDNVESFNPGTGTDTDYSFFILHQIKGVGTGFSNNLHTLVINDRQDGSNYFRVLDGQNNWGGKQSTFDQIDPNSSIPIKKWFKIELEVKMGDGDGIYRLKQDGVLLFDLKNQRTYPQGENIKRTDTMWCTYHRYMRSANDPLNIKWYMSGLQVLDLS